MWLCLAARGFKAAVLVLCICTHATLCQQQLRYKIMEEQPVGTDVGNIVTDAGLDSKYNAAVLRTLRFSLDANTGPRSGFLAVTAAGGALRVAKRIDRESICSGLSSCILTADVTIRPLRYYEVIHIELSVMDINDNWPTFQKNRMKLFIPESRARGVVAVVPIATDEDIGTNAVQEYSMLTKSSHFKLAELTVKSTF